MVTVVDAASVTRTLAASDLGHENLFLIRGSQDGTALGLVGEGSATPGATNEGDAYRLVLETAQAEAFNLLGGLDGTTPAMGMERYLGIADFTDDLSGFFSLRAVDEPSINTITFEASLRGMAESSSNWVMTGLIDSDAPYGATIAGDGSSYAVSAVTLRVLGDPATGQTATIDGPFDTNPNRLEFPETGFSANAVSSTGDRVAFAGVVESRNAVDAFFGRTIKVLDPSNNNEVVFLWELDEPLIATFTGPSDPDPFFEGFTDSDQDVNARQQPILEFSPDGTYLLVGAVEYEPGELTNAADRDGYNNNRGLTLVNLVTGERTELQDSHTLSHVAFTADGSRVAVSTDGGAFFVYDLATGRETGQFDVQGLDGVTIEDVTGLAFSADGDTLYFSTSDADLVVNDTSGVDIFEIDVSEATGPIVITDATTASQLASALIGRERGEGDGRNNLKESGAVHLGNGVYLTDSRFRAEDDGTGLSQDYTFIHGAETDNEQTAFVVPESTRDRNARDLDKEGADEILLINTEVDAGSQIGVVVYGDPNEAQGDFIALAYSRLDDGGALRQYDLTIQAGAYQNETLKNRSEANDVWISDGTGMDVALTGGAQGSGVFQEIDGQEYLVGILVGPRDGEFEVNFAIDPISDNYSDLARQMLRFGDADDYATNLLIAAQAGGTFEGSDLNEILQGGAGDDRLVGEGGTDRLIDGAGSDRLFGGEGADVFVFGDDGETDRVMDFDISEDRIDVSAFEVTFAELEFEDQGNGRVRFEICNDLFEIRDGDGTLDLVGADLTESLFIF